MLFLQGPWLDLLERLWYVAPVFWPTIMDVDGLTLQEILQSPAQYVIPGFQRYYVWKEENWDQLWDDLTLLLVPSEKDRRHFMGSIACLPPARPQSRVVPAYQVIDGQQRLITLTILLCALRDAAVSLGWGDLAAEVEENYVIHRLKREQEQERYKVFPRFRDRQSYLALVDHNAQAATGQIAEAHAYFSKKLEHHGLLKSSETLSSLLEALVNRLDFVMITLGGENPFKIFKSLNSTGVDLEQSDLIRNHIFMAIKEVADQDAFDDDQWRPLERHFEKDGKLEGKSFTAFFRDVLMRDGNYVGENAVFEVFERENPLSGIKSGEVVAELERSAKLHDIIRGKAKHPSSEVELAIRAIRSLNATTAYPLVLALLDVHDANTLPLDDLVACLRAISGFVLRRYVCGGNSRAYGRWFCSACKVLGDNPPANLTAFLMDKGWPSDDSFIPSFQSLNLYEGQYGRAVLDGIEQSIQADSEPVLLDSCWIEHILPQSVTDDDDGKAWQAALGDGWRQVHEQWVHSPGNLTLVGSDYNNAMQKKPFAAKKPVLKESRVYLNKHFAEASLTTWTEENIKARGWELGSIASRVWAGPPLISPRPVSPVNPMSPRRTRTLDKVNLRALSKVIDTSGLFDGWTVKDEIMDKVEVRTLSSGEKKWCSRMLDKATALLWQRVGAGVDEFHGHRTHSELAAFHDRHPRLLQCVKHIFEQDRDGHPISGLKLSAGQSAACLYLMGSAATRPDAYRSAEQPGEKVLDWQHWEKAQQFWVDLADGKLKSVTNALANPYGLKEATEASGIERLCVLAKAWELYVTGRKIASKNLRLSFVDKEGVGKVLNEWPTFGGIDKGNPKEADTDEVAPAAAPAPAPEKLEE